MSSNSRIIQALGQPVLQFPVYGLDEKNDPPQALRNATKINLSLWRQFQILSCLGNYNSMTFALPCWQIQARFAYQLGDVLHHGHGPGANQKLTSQLPTVRPECCIDLGIAPREDLVCYCCPQAFEQPSRSHHAVISSILDNSLVTLNTIKENTARWVELLQKIKVADVSSQNRATGSPGAYVEQSIV